MKRIILSFIAIMIFVVGASAQYTYTTNHVLGAGNPGGLNTQTDSYTTGYTQVTNGGEATNFWSDTVGIGFPFDFYGAPVTHFKVTGNGVITFDTSATMIPSDINTNLPAANSNIPNNSILGFWDSFSAGAPIGTTDRVWVGTYGTAPNRQRWIKYYSYEYGANAAGTSHGTSYAYFAIVLEETTNKVYVVDMHYASTGQDLTTTVGLQQNATTAVQIGDSTTIMPGPIASGHADNDYYEFTPFLLVNNNAALESIDEPFAPLSGGLQDVKATLKNMGVNALTSVAVQWTVNNVAQTPYVWTGNLASLGSTSITLGQYNVGPGNLDIVAWTTAPNGMSDPDMSNDTASVSLCTPLSGTFTVGGTNPDYADISAAIDAIANCGLNGPIVFDVAAGTYQGGIEITEIIGVSALNNITFNGAGIGNTIITYDRSGTLAATLEFNGADYFTFRNMTIENTASTAAFASQAWGIHFTNSANYNTFDSCLIQMDRTTTSTYILPVVASGSSSSSTTLGDNASNLVIKNSEIAGGSYGIRLYGPTGTTSYNNYNQILNNTFTDQYSYSIYGDEQDSLTIIGNTINGFRATFGYGIYLFDQMHPNIQSNVILDTKNYGIYISDANFDMPPVSRGIIANNIIKSIGTSAFNYAIYADDWEDMDVFHNTVYTAGAATAFYCNDLSNTVVKNNIFYSTDGYALRSLDATNTFTLDYNLYYSEGQYLAQEFNVNLDDLLDWKLGAPGSNQNSLEGDPNFLDKLNGDLHVNVGPGLVAGDNSVGVLFDIDGDARPLAPTTTVDMGADEILVQILDAGITNFDSPVAPVTPGLNPIEVTLKNNGVTPLTAVTINWTADGIPQTPFSWTGNLTVGQEANNVVIGNYNIANGFYDFEIWTEAPNGGVDNDSSNDTLYYTTCTPLTGTYTVGSDVSDDFATMSEAVASISGCGVAGPVTLNVAPGTYTEYLRLEEVPGASATNTITFNGVNRDSVLLTHDATGGQKATILFRGADYYVIENMTIENTGATNAWGARLERGANNNTIQNSRVVVPVVTISNAANCIIASGSPTSFSTQGQNANGTLIKDNELIGGYGSVIMYGQTGAGNLNKDNTVDGNEMIDNYFYGAYFYAQENPTGINNTIREFGSTGGYGMYHSQGRGSVFEGNFITDAGTYGIYLAGIHTSTLYPSQKDASIVNNMVTCNNTGRGIYISSGKRVNIYHNTVSTENGVGLYIGFTEDSMDIRNNILTTTGAEAIEFSNSAGPKAIDIIDYNVYHRRDGGNFAEIGNDFYSDLATWQTDDAARNTASVVGDPLFADVSTGDLHLVGGVANDMGDNTVGVMVDIDGDIRPAASSTTVDAGADEYTPLDDDVKIVEILYTRAACPTPNDTVMVVVQNLGLNNVSGLPVTVEVTGGLNTSLSTTAAVSLPFLAIDTVMVGTFNSMTGGDYVFTGYTALVGDQNTANDSTETVGRRLMSSGTVVDVACQGDTTGAVDLAIANPLGLEGSLTTSFASNNGCSANYFDLNVTKPGGITIRGFEVNTSQTSTMNVDVYYKTGTWVGFDQDPSAWTLVESVQATGAGIDNPTAVTLSNPFIVPTGVTGIFISGGTGWRYIGATGAAPVGTPFAANTDLEILGGGGVCNAAVGASSALVPRSFSGSVIYDGESMDYLWSSTDTTEDLTNIGVGTYSVTATDGIGCVTTNTFTVTEPTASTPTITGVTGDSVSCFGVADGNVTATVTGGTGQLTYMWSNGDVSQNLTNIGPGNYSLIVTDANGCTDSTGVANGIIITQPDSLQGTVAYTIFNCDSVNISSTLMGGTTPYTYNWSGGGSGPAIAVGSGNYDLTVTDINGCTETVSVTTVLPATLMVTAAETASDTSGAGTGAATATVVDGTAPYTYAWSNGDTDSTITGVIFGTYTVTVTDANGCTATGSVNINFPTNTENLTVIGAIDMFPNPTNGLVTFNVAMKSNDDLAITIFNAVGQEMTTIRKDNVNELTQRFDTSILASGVYFVRFTAGDDVVTKRLIVRK